MLKSFHARHTGASREVFHTGGQGPGESYERLAAAVVEGPVLDLGCGDGPILELLLARGLDATGLDMSPEELAQARERLGPDVRLAEAQAHAIPFDDGAFATVVSHMAFMLMRPLDEIVAEIARVLRPGGRFVATIGANTPPDDVAKAFWVKYDELVADLPKFPRFGDPRVWDTERLMALFAGPRWTGFAQQLFPIVVHVPAEHMREWFVISGYHVDMLPPDRQRALLDWVEANHELLAPGGSMTWTFGARQFAVTRI